MGTSTKNFTAGAAAKARKAKRLQSERNAEQVEEKPPKEAPYERLLRRLREDNGARNGNQNKQ